MLRGIADSALGNTQRRRRSAGRTSSSQTEKFRRDNLVFVCCSWHSLSTMAALTRRSDTHYITDLRSLATTVPTTRCSTRGMRTTGYELPNDVSSISRSLSSDTYFTT
ncbi:MAG: hypothetical protein JWL97_17 [Gemmatimonadales bacterium]|jgi:hypothetical protein|nr:hypothetical protein [Gemmatimonadales bacterium]